MLNASYRTIAVTLAGMAVATAISILPREVRAEKTIWAASTFRILIDNGGTCPSRPRGSVVLRRQGMKQSFAVDVHYLAGANLGAFRGDTFSTNFPAFLIAALNQNDPTNGGWNLKLTSTTGAPLPLGVADVTNLVDKFIYIATPGYTNIIGGVTNLVGCTTNIVGGVTNLVGCTTNIVGSVTNIIIGAVLWAPVPPLMANPAQQSFKGRNPLEHTPSSQLSHGWIKDRFGGTRGESFLDIRAMALPRGNEYAVWMEDGGSFTNIGPMVFSLSGAVMHFTRDTRKGDPLPLEVPYIGDLSGRSIEIRDQFDDVHLTGVIP
jgi:hypothetical protein